MNTEALTQNWVDKLRTTALELHDGSMVYDAKTIDALVQQIIQEGFRAGAAGGKPGPRKIRRFSFDVAKLQADARTKMLASGRSWQDMSDDYGIAVNALKQHLGEKPPKEMGLRLVMSLLVFINDFDVLGYLVEEAAEIKL